MFNPNLPTYPDQNINLNQSELLGQIVDMFNSDVFISGRHGQLTLTQVDDDNYRLTFDNPQNHEDTNSKTTEGNFESIINLLSKMKSELYNSENINFGNDLKSLTSTLRSVFSDQLEVKSDKFDFQNPTFKLKFNNKIVLENYPEDKLVKLLNNLIYIFNKN
ncbi:MAG: hypothetical protein WC422_04410 [Candidatus Paceibacterota bacterium]|jgi:hypothetical protein